MIDRAHAVPFFRSLARMSRSTLPRAFAAVLSTSIVLAACGGGGGGAVTPRATPTPTPTPSPTPVSTGIVSPNAAVAYTCPTSDAVLDSSTRASSGGTVSRVHRFNGLGTTSLRPITPGLLAITYSASVSSGAAAMLAQSRELAAGATLLHSLTFSQIGKVVHVVSVPPARLDAIAATLRSESGVESVAPTGGRRFTTSVTTPYYPNDPFFNGFSVQQNEAASSQNVTTYHVGPYDETASIPGQWDMHAIKLEDALAYSQPTNGSGVVNSNALGLSSIKLAIIDTGEDPTHPELASKIAYQRCFITNVAGHQDSSFFETDALGHGTDVAGIAAEDTNNAFGFTGAGGNVSIYAYRVFPTPDDNCTNENTTDGQCGADTADIASAINDAVAQHVNVISMSLGGSTCGTGTSFASNGDSDPTEGLAVANAIANNVIVVAASGNSGGTGVAAPGCDTGVIAVGATGLDDGVATGSAPVGGTSSAPVEYVASYTQYGSTNTYQNASSWGIVAPGGDPADAESTATTSSGVDNLHWIENIWTSTPYKANTSDTSFLGNCIDDYPAGAGASPNTPPVDCRTLIAGTSMATPHVAGAAALILSVSALYQSPAAMKQLLCSTADTLTVTTATQGCGRLNVYRAMAKAVGDTNLP